MRVGLARISRELARPLTGLLAAGVLIGAGPAAALAAGGSTPVAPALPGSTSPFAPGVPVSPASVPTAATPTVAGTSSSSSASSNGLSGTNAVLIALGAVIVLGGIAYFIWYDARRRAPVRHGAGGRVLETAGGRASGSKRPAKSRKLSAAERKRRKRGRAR